MCGRKDANFVVDFPQADEAKQSLGAFAGSFPLMNTAVASESNSHACATGMGMLPHLPVSLRMRADLQVMSSNPEMGGLDRQADAFRVTWRLPIA